jgi:hypothetical protein
MFTSISNLLPELIKPDIIINIQAYLRIPSENLERPKLFDSGRNEARILKSFREELNFD